MERPPAIPPTPVLPADARTQASLSANGNATTHGLTATKLLPILAGELIARHQHDAIAEWRPQTSTEHVLVKEMTRHTAALERIELAELGERTIPGAVYRDHKERKWSLP